MGRDCPQAAGVPQGTLPAAVPTQGRWHRGSVAVLRGQRRLCHSDSPGKSSQEELGMPQPLQVILVLFPKEVLALGEPRVTRAVSPGP